MMLRCVEPLEEGAESKVIRGDHEVENGQVSELVLKLPMPPGL